MKTPVWQVRAGFIPLMDAAPLIAARDGGFATREGIDLVLSRESSWATIRDRLAVSHLDVAHALAPLPIAANLGLGPLPSALLVPMALGFGGNTVTVSRDVWQRLEANGAIANFDPLSVVAALHAVVILGRAAGRRRLVFGIVHHYSAHHYDLAYWLAAGGIIAGRDVELVVLPPQLMGAALASGRIDGFCAGEPWGTAAAASAAGVIATTNSHIWRSSPEKVLSVRKDWAEDNTDRLAALVRAVQAAGQWCDAPENRTELLAMLARADHLGLEPAIMAPSLERRLMAADGSVRPVPGFLTFAAQAATFPWTSHALWFLSQMARWGEIQLSPETIAIARNTYRPDIYRHALEGSRTTLPAANAKVEGALTVATPVGSTTGGLSLGPDGFFDGRAFDPDRIEAYVDELKAADGRL